jgi:hypothetical protein
VHFKSDLFPTFFHMFVKNVWKHVEKNILKMRVQNMLKHQFKHVKTMWKKAVETLLSLSYIFHFFFPDIGFFRFSLKFNVKL